MEGGEEGPRGFAPSPSQARHIILIFRALGKQGLASDGFQMQHHRIRRSLTMLSFVNKSG